MNSYNKKDMNKSMIVTTILLSLITLIIIIVVLITNKSISSNYLIAIDTNPRIMLLVKNNNVINVYGVNDDGKKVIISDEFTNSSVVDTINKIISTEYEYGYLTNYNNDVNTININIYSDISISTLNYSLKNNINALINRLDKDIKVNINNSNKKFIDILKSSIIECNDYYKENELSNLSNTDLLNILSKEYKEKETLASKSLEEYYNMVKNYQVDINRLDVIKSIINTSHKVDENIVNDFTILVEKLQSAKESLYTLYYDTFIKEDSVYFKSFIKRNEYLQDISKMKEYINDLVDGEYKNSEIARLHLLENYILLEQQTMDKLKNRSLEVINKSEESINKQIDIVNNFILQNNLSDIVNNEIDQINKLVNEQKNNFFKEFEEKHNLIINKTKEYVISKKS